MRIFANPFLPLIACIAGASCSNPLPYGPGRVEVFLTDVTVVKSTPAFVRGVHVGKPSVRLAFSSPTDLASFFNQWDRQIQTRCKVTGAEGGGQFNAPAVGPFFETHDISERGAPGHRSVRNVTAPYRYTAFSFFDLRASDTVYEMGRPRSTFDLTSQRFERLECFVIGVTKAPVLFPKSNSVTISREQFLQSLKDAK